MKYREWRLQRHIKKWGSKNRGYFQCFDKEWFIKHQRGLLFLLNAPVLKYWFRWVLRIHKDLSFAENVDLILPNTYRVKIGFNQYRSDFRTHNKFSKRIYYAFQPVWWALHFWDWLLADRYVPELSFGFDELTAYPDADPETNTCDGYWYMIAEGVFYSLLEVHNMTTPGANAMDGGGADFDTDFAEVSYGSGWWTIARSKIGFNTSSIGAGMQVTEAKLKLTKSWRGSVGAAQVDIVSHNSYSNTNITREDYAISRFGNNIFASYTDTAEKALSGAGCSSINVTGNTFFGLMEHQDYSVSYTEIRKLYFDSADVTGTTTDPKLSVTYKLPEVFPNNVQNLLTHIRM